MSFGAGAIVKRTSAYLRYGASLPGYLHKTMTLDDARAQIREQLRRRETSFLGVLERGVYAYPTSPFARLLHHAGIEHADVERLVRDCGLEGALQRLYDAGVYVTYEELRGQAPVKRGSLEFSVQRSDFQNPLLTKSFEARSGGSRGAPTRVVIDLDMIVADTAIAIANIGAHQTQDRPIAVWRPVPPDASGIMAMIIFAKVGYPASRWFSQTKPRWAPAEPHGPMLAYTLLASRVMRRAIPMPIVVPRDQPLPIVEWLAGLKRGGKLGYLTTSCSSAVRICLAAREHGIDISGTKFGVGDEPYTPGKAAVLAEAGATAVPFYGMTEIGRIGLGCANPAALDEVHLTTDKVAVLERERRMAGGSSVRTMLFTTLIAGTPLLLINAEQGDVGLLEQRECGCLFDDLGYSTHLSGIYAFDKVTSEGVTFIGSDIYSIVEELLPGRFGGFPTDYQFVEEEEGGLPRVSILISPRVGEVDPAAVVEAVLQSLETRRGGRAMAEQWRQAGTLRVLRREPFATADRKVLPLFVISSAKSTSSSAPS